jgi:hypothetical protein
MSFYNINNEEISQESILNDLIGYYQSLGEAGKTKIDDFHEGSEVRTLLEVLSHLAYNILEEQNETLRNHFINTADGEYLDLLGSNPNVNLPRIQGTTATGLVKFSLPDIAVEEHVIPADTVVSSDEVEYVTVEDGLISVGESYTYVPIECTIDGVDGNCSIGSIVNCELSDYTVLNDEAIVDGSDFEEDEEYRERLLEFIRSDNFGSRGYYENILLDIPGVHDILENNNPSASIDYYVNTNDVDITGSVYNQILEYFTDNNNIVVGHSSSFHLSDLHELSFTVTVNADCGYSEDDLKDFFYCYLHGGTMQEYPLDYPGLDMGTEIDETTMLGELTEYFTSISSVEISDIDNVYDETTTHTFDFQTVDDTYSAYSLDTVTVVFDDGE